MKKLRNISTLALTGMIGLLGAASIATTTVSTQTTESITTYANTCNPDGSIPEGKTSCGDIYAVDGSGMTFVDEEITLMIDTDTSDNDNYVEYVANLRISISAYESNGNNSIYMKDGYDLDVVIDMPDANDTAVLEGRTGVYSYVDGADDQVGLVVSSGQNSGYYYFDFESSNGSNNDFWLAEDDSTENYMNVYKSNSEMRMLILNDPNSDIAINTYDNTDTNNSWEYTQTRVAYKKSFYLQDLDSSIESNNLPIYYTDLNIVPVYDADHYVIGVEIDYTIHLDGATVDQLKKSTVASNSGDPVTFGHLLIPYTYTWGGEEYWYLYDVNINSDTHWNITTDEGYGYYGDWEKIDDDTYKVTMTNATEDVTTILFNGLLAEGIEYRVIDIHPANIDGTGTETLNYHPTVTDTAAPGPGGLPADNPLDPFTRGNLNEQYLQEQDMIDGIDNQTIYYNKMWFIPMVYLFPLDADGNAYLDAEQSGNNNPTDFHPFYFIVASEKAVLDAVNQADPVEYLVQPWQILLLVWGSTFVTFALYFLLKAWRDRIEMRGFAFSSKHAKEHAERVRQADLMLIEQKQAELDRLIHEVEEIDEKLGRSK